MELTVDILLNWMIDNLPPTAMADLMVAVDTAGSRACQLVELNPLGNPLADELVFDKVFYYLRDHLGIMTSSFVGDDATTEWLAFRDEQGSPVSRRETEALAIAAVLRKES